MDTPTPHPLGSSRRAVIVEGARNASRRCRRSVGAVPSAVLHADSNVGGPSYRECMEDPLAGIDAALEVLAVVGGERAPEGLTSGELAAVNEAFGRLRRHVDAAYARVATEVAHRSRSELGGDSFARNQGFRSAAAMISGTSGATVGDALRLIQVGQATQPRATLTGEPLPARHPHVAAAVAAGRVGVPAAAAITGMLDRIAVRADAQACDAMEANLVEAAPGLTVDQLNKLVLRAEALLDPDGLEPKERDLRAERSLVFREDRDGSVVMNARWDPESGAYVKVAIEGMVTGILRRNEHLDQAMRDQRSVRQMQADALVELCRHGIACSTVPTAPSTSVVLRMELDALVSGIGAATIDGVSQPVSAGVARRMAADGAIIPCVLGGKSEILDLGRSKRLFTTAQRLALGERDGGCAFCGAPPGHAVAHHIRWWTRDAGPTDLRNGILLCTACHHRIHDDGWDIQVDGPGLDARVWFIPPPWLDASQRPRKGGRGRFDVAA